MTGRVKLIMAYLCGVPLPESARERAANLCRDKFHAFVEETKGDYIGDAPSAVTKRLAAGGAIDTTLWADLFATLCKHGNRSGVLRRLVAMQSPLAIGAILTTACSRGHLRVVRYLHEKCGAALNRSLLAVAAAHSRFDVQRYLREKMPDATVDMVDLAAAAAAALVCDETTRRCDPHRQRMFAAQTRDRLSTQALDA